MAKFPADAALTTVTIVPDVRIRSLTGARVRGDGLYVEAVYVNLIGVCAWAAYRRFLRELGAAPGRVELSVEELATSLGIPRRKMLATLKRLVDFRIVRWSEGTLQVPGLLPVLPEKVLPRLSDSALRCHLRTVRELELQP